MRAGTARQHFPASARNISIIAVIALWIFFAVGPALHAQVASVGLGTADDFAVLAGQTITNTGATTITGDIGLHPGSSVTGFGTVTWTGDLHQADAVAEQAKIDLVTAYDNAAGRTPATTVATDLAGQNLPGGVYTSATGTFEINGTLTLDAENDPDKVFIFQMESSLITGSASSVNLINGAEACNVFWQVGSSATLGSGSTFRGNILALTSISLETGAIVEGRVLARNGSVTMQANTITRATCIESTNTTTTTTSTTLAPPVGGVDTGGGSTSGQSMIPLLVGSSLLIAGVGVFEVRRRLLIRRSD